MIKYIYAIIAVAVIGAGVFILTNKKSAETAADGFEFPEVTKVGDDYQVNIDSSQPAPEWSYNRRLEEFDIEAPAGKEGRVVKHGEVVKLKFKMIQWSTGEVVDSSGSYPVEIAAGMNESEQADLLTSLNQSVIITVPKYLSESVVGAEAGNCQQIVFSANMIDLPDMFNSKDGYVLITHIENVYTPEEFKKIVAERLAN